VGACALIFFIVRENKILRERKNFLSLFTHDLKTTISSLRLMLERLSQHSHDSALKSEVKEIQGIGTRLSQQLQNALQVTYQSKQNLVLETLDFGDQINYLRHQWPDLSFKISDKALVLADATALRSICINLIQNAFDHAQASEIVFKIEEISKDFIQVKCLTPGGRALPVSVDEFRKHLRAFQSIDGSGVGLKLTLEMMDKMGGRAQFDVDDQGVLEVSLIFKKGKPKEGTKL
jgi:signal transduction histidine kinase